MINKLKRKFIILATVSTFVLMAMLVGIMNVINYSVVVKESDATIDVLIRANAAFFDNNARPDDKPDDKPDDDDDDDDDEDLDEDEDSDEEDEDDDLDDDDEEDEDEEDEEDEDDDKE